MVFKKPNFYFIPILAMCKKNIRIYTNIWSFSYSTEWQPLIALFSMANAESWTPTTSEGYRFSISHLFSAFKSLLLFPYDIH